MKSAVRKQFSRHSSGLSGLNWGMTCSQLVSLMLSVWHSLPHTGPPALWCGPNVAVTDQSASVRENRSRRDQRCQPRNNLRFSQTMSDMISTLCVEGKRKTRGRNCYSSGHHRARRTCGWQVGDRAHDRPGTETERRGRAQTRHNVTAFPDLWMNLGTEP